MAYPEAKVELLLGGAYVDITTDVYVRGRITITRGRKDRGGRPSPSRCRFHLKNSPEVKARYSPVNPLSEYYGLLLPNTVCRISVNPNGTRWYRFCGVIPDFVLDRNPTDKDRWVAVDAFGLVYALQGGNPPSYDSMRRFMARQSPRAYWPLTDGEEAGHALEVAAGGQPVRAVGESGSFYQGQPNWGSGRLAPWLEPVVGLPNGKVGLLTAPVPMAADGGGWAFDHVRSGPGNQDYWDYRDIGAGSNDDQRVTWMTGVDPAFNSFSVSVMVERETGGLAPTLVADVTAPQLFTNTDPHHIRLSVASAAGGTNTLVQLHIDGVPQLGATTFLNVGYRPLNSVTHGWDQSDAPSGSNFTTGHWAYWGTNPPDALDCYKALLGHAGERAGRRIERLCGESGIPLRVIGDLDGTPLMGPQRADALMDLLEAAIAVDGGTLTDATDELALEYRTNRSKYSQGVS
ncbi:MAG: hypothetical protein HOY75_27550 [Streptomyces sp.]|nr:hypothetical protein [Streptomyces sp.]